MGLARAGSFGLDGAVGRPSLPVSVALLLAALLPGLAAAQVPEVRPAEEPSGRAVSLALGPGVTTNITRPGDSTVTLTAALSWNFAGDWTVSVAPYWEREYETDSGAWRTYDELSFSVAVSYTFAPNWSVSGEIDLGCVENSTGAWLRNPEYGAGIGLAYAIPFGDRWNLLLGPTLAWKWSDREWSIGFNSGVSFDL